MWIITQVRGYLFKWQLWCLCWYKWLPRKFVLNFSALATVLFIMFSISALIPGQYNISLARCLLFTIPRWDLCMSSNMRLCMVGGMAIRSPLYTMPSDTANWLQVSLVCCLASLAELFAGECLTPLVCVLAVQHISDRSQIQS